MDVWAVVEHGKPLQKIQRPRPEPTGNQVLIKVTHCGVCHSDLHFWEGYYDLGGGKRLDMAKRGVKLPRAVGHEILGNVAKIGPDVKDHSVGQRRIVYPWVGCGQCRRCRNEEDSLCMKMQSLGLVNDGGFAEYVLVPDTKYLVDPGDVDPAVACTFGCSGVTVMNSIEKLLPLESDDPVVLIGAGGLGLAAICMLRAIGHENIISVDISPEKRDAAKEAGAATVIDGKAEDASHQILKAASRPIVGAIDFVGSGNTAELAFEILEKGGTMVSVGLLGGEFKVSLVNLMIKATRVLGNYTGNPQHLRDVAKFAREGKLTPIPVTEISWDEANDALMRLRDGKVTGRLVLKHP